MSEQTYKFSRLAVYGLNGILAIIGFVMFITAFTIDPVEGGQSSGGLITYSLFILGISALGAVGAFKQNTCLLKTYIVIAGLWSILMLVMFIIAIIAPKILREPLNNAYNDALKKYEENMNNHKYELPEPLNSTQRTIHCCGNSGPKDYEDKHVAFPKSCCGMDENDDSQVCDGDKVYKDGCLEKMIGLIEDNVKSAWLMFITMLSMFIGTIASCIVVRNIRYAQHFG